MTALKDYSERMMRAAIRRLPPGTYRAEDYLDNDGITDRPVKIAATGDHSAAIAPRIDFTGSDAQVEGSVNANYAVAVSATTYVFRCLVREDIPYTAGVMRPLEVIAPERAGGQRAASGRDGRGQCRNVAAHHRRHSRARWRKRRPS